MVKEINLNKKASLDEGDLMKVIEKMSKTVI